MNKKAVAGLSVCVIIIIVIILIFANNTGLQGYLAFKYHTPNSAKAEVVTEVVKEEIKQAEIKYNPDVLWTDEDLSESMTTFGLNQSTDFLIVYSILKQYCDIYGEELSSFEVSTDAVYEDGVWLYVLDNGVTKLKIVADFYNGESNGYLKVN